MKTTIRYCFLALLLVSGKYCAGQTVRPDTATTPGLLYGGTVRLTRTNWISDNRQVDAEAHASIEGGLVVIKPLTRHLWLGAGIEANTRRSTRPVNNVPTQVRENFAQLPLTAWYHRQLVQRQAQPLRTMHQLLGAGVYIATLTQQELAGPGQPTYTTVEGASYTKYGVLFDYSLVFLPARAGVMAGHQVGLRAGADIRGLTGSSSTQTFANYASIGIQYALLLSFN